MEKDTTGDKIAKCTHGQPLLDCWLCEHEYAFNYDDELVGGA